MAASPTGGVSKGKINLVFLHDLISDAANQTILEARGGLC